MMTEKCSAYVQGPSLCRNGFPQNAACVGVVCHACGKPNPNLTAPCMRDDASDKVFAAWFDESGRPKFAPKRPTHG